MRIKSEHMMVTLGLIGLVLLLVAAAQHEREENAEWAAFAAAHQCRVVKHERSRTASTIKGDFITLPERTTWRCADEREFVR